MYGMFVYVCIYIYTYMYVFFNIYIFIFISICIFSFHFYFFLKTRFDLLVVDAHNLPIFSHTIDFYRVSCFWDKISTDQIRIFVY